jgi:hypothetical protein
MYIPYSLEAFTIGTGGAAIARGPFYSGVFHSEDAGQTWLKERVSDTYDYLPGLKCTKSYCYFFAVSLPSGTNNTIDLWFSRKPVDAKIWDKPIVATKTFGRSGLLWKYVVEADEETVHLCWLDQRHEKTRLNLVYPRRENYEVVYSRRKDSDTTWSNDVILSKGLLYSYAPSMSVEGDRIVVVWSGIRDADDWHHEQAANDIYYVTSNDGGKSWAKMSKLTDSAGKGITSGRPQVILLDGIIHVCYIQGTLNLKQESPGLSLLNQPPWPVYYQQLPFPN